MARPDLKAGLMQKLSAGPHVQVARNIVAGLPPVEDVSTPSKTDTLDDSRSPTTLISSTANLPGKTILDRTPSDGLISDRVTRDRIPSDGNTVRQINTETAKQLNSPTVQPSHGLSVARSNSDNVPQFNIEAVRQSDRSTVNHLDRHTVRPLNSETVDRPPERSQHDQYETVSYNTIPLDVLTLPYNQAVILEFLIQAGGITNARTISDATRIGIPSVRDAITRLVRRGFMANPVTVKNAAFQGFSYVLNTTMTDHFLSIGGLEQKGYKTVSQQTGNTVSYTNCNTVKQPDRTTLHSSSSLESQITTTTDTHKAVTQYDSDTLKPSHGTPSAIFILTGTAGAYWEGEGLQERQARQWCEQFELKPEELRQQLEWARFDLVINSKQSEVRKDSVSWFFGCLRQTGGSYARPSNYKSPAEMRAEQMEQAVRELAEARERQTAAEVELKFQQILSSPDGTEYKKILSLVGEFAREMGGKTLETAMREVYGEILSGKYNL